MLCRCVTSRTRTPSQFTSLFKWDFFNFIELFGERFTGICTDLFGERWNVRFLASEAATDLIECWWRLKRKKFSSAFRINQRVAPLYNRKWIVCNVKYGNTGNTVYCATEAEHWRMTMILTMLDIIRTSWIAMQSCDAAVAIIKATNSYTLFVHILQTTPVHIQFNKVQRKMSGSATDSRDNHFHSSALN